MAGHPLASTCTGPGAHLAPGPVMIPDGMSEFQMPPCWKHFHKGYRWWCKRCRSEAESQFRETQAMLWSADPSARDKIRSEHRRG